MSGFYVNNWMLGGGLGLKGCELLIFAKIASFTRQGKTMFESEQSLADYTGYSKRKVVSAMKSLLDQGLIVRSKQQTKYLTYEYTVSDVVKHKYLSKGGEKTSPVPVKKVHQDQGKNFIRTREEISPNNKNDSINHNTMDIDRTDLMKRKMNYGTHTNPALDVGSPEEFKGGNRL